MDARFCRFCGAPQAGSPGNVAGAGRPTEDSPGFQSRLRQIFPRHHLQDEFLHVATIAAFLIAVVGFIFGFFLSLSWLATSWLLFSIALLLFLILRESNLSHIRGRAIRSPGENPTRYHASRSTGDAPSANSAIGEPAPPRS